MVYQGDAIQYIYETPDILHGILQEEQNILRESTAFSKIGRYRKSI